MAINLNKGILAKIRAFFVPVDTGVLKDIKTDSMEHIQPFVGATKVDQAGIDLIHHFESCRLEAYADSGGVWTIGWGNTRFSDGSRVKKGDKITQAEADELFLTILSEKERIVLGKIIRPLQQYELNAAVSFAYNAGTGYWSNNVFRDYNLWLNIENRLSGDDMRRYWENLAITAGGVKLNGLIRRRKSEAEMYLTGKLNFFQ